MITEGEVNVKDEKIRETNLINHKFDDQAAWRTYCIGNFGDVTTSMQNVGRKLSRGAPGGYEGWMGMSRIGCGKRPTSKAKCSSHQAGTGSLIEDGRHGVPSSLISF